MPDPAGEQRFVVEGSAAGVSLTGPGGEVDVAIVAEPRVIVALAAGELDPVRAVRDGSIHVEGEVGALADFPLLFERSFDKP